MLTASAASSLYTDLRTGKFLDITARSDFSQGCLNCFSHVLGMIQQVSSTGPSEAKELEAPNLKHQPDTLTMFVWAPHVLCDLL
jgi:hypothetical protein